MALKDHSWFLVHCRPRQERRAAEHLSRQGMECYLPLARNPQRRFGGDLIEPLFARYLFLRAQAGELGPVASTRGVAGLVRFGEQAARVPEWIIEGLRQSADRVTGLVNLPPAGLEHGDRVEVYRGPWAGLRGVFEAPDGHVRAWMLIELLGARRRVSVSLGDLRAAH